jgi:hypothetical protein
VEDWVLVGRPPELGPGLLLAACCFAAAAA